MPQLLRFSTEMLPARDRMAAFREEFSRQILKLDVVDLSGGRPRMDITLLKLGPVAVVDCFGAPTEFIRDARCVKDGRDDFLLLVASRGRIDTHQAGHEQTLNVGSAALQDYGRPFRNHASAGRARTSNVSVPAAMLKALVPYPEDRAGHLLRPGPALQLLDGYLACIRTVKTAGWVGGYVLSAGSQAASFAAIAFQFQGRSRSSR